MSHLLDRATLLTMTSAFIVALLCILPGTRGQFPVAIIAAGLHIGDALFHEMGHTVFAWLFGRPAIPMIFTLFGADQAGGMTLQWNYSWPVQVAAFAVLAYACYRAREDMPVLFLPAIVFSLFIVLVAVTGYAKLVIAFMGHGSSILVGGFLLFRAWIYLDSRSAYERWLNALFGFFLTLYNLSFSYGLAFKGDAQDYSEHVAFGIAHNDFMVMATLVPGWSVHGIGIFTVLYAAFSMIGSLVAAIYLRSDFREM
ncbi:MAG: hypothetical protein WDN72_02350 [Alphaproteobacteria bacterium]